MPSSHFHNPYLSHPTTPHRTLHSRNPSLGGTSGFSMISNHYASSASLATHTGGGLGDRGTRALLELQRVLYRGKGYVDENGRERGEVGWEEVEMFIEETLEMDCIYESPLLTFPNRPLLLSAFLLSTKTTTLQLPSIRPTALLSHSRNIGRAGWKMIFGSSAPKGKSPQVQKGQGMEGDGKHWFHPWGISSECGEMGTMECYDGYHIGFIEQTVTLDILPEFLAPKSSPPAAPYTPPTRTSILPTSADFLPTYSPPAPPSMIQSLSASLLRHSIQVHTIVTLNEFGKIAAIRDIIDIRDLAEALVPFGMGRALGWVGRRLGGFAVAGLGGLVGNHRTEDVDEGYGIVRPMEVYQLSAPVGSGISPTSSEGCDTLPLPEVDQAEGSQQTRLQPPINLSPKSKHQHRTRLTRLTTATSPQPEGLMLSNTSASPEAKRDQDVLLFGGKRKRGRLGFGEGAEIGMVEAEVGRIEEEADVMQKGEVAQESSRENGGSGSAPDVDEGYPGSG